MKELILIKLGGSLITDKDKAYTAKPEVIKRLAKEIKSCRDKGFHFLISHGSGSFGHTSATKYGTAEGLKREKESVYGLAIVQYDAITINRIVNEIFLEEGLPVLSFVPSSFTLSESKNLSKIFVDPIIEALKIDALPLVFGDVILDKKLGCCIYSGERTLDNLIRPLKEAGHSIGIVIHCGSTDGVYNKGGKTIPAITLKSFKNFTEVISYSSSTDVTGGMLHKVEECLAAAKKGINSLIINGNIKGNLKKAIFGQKVKGTWIK